MKEVMWFNGNVWALWNDICRCPHEIQSVLSLSQLVARRDSVSHGECQWVAGRLAGAASQKATEKKLWINIAVCLCLCLHLSLSLSLSYQKRFNPFWRRKRPMYFYNQVLWFHHSLFFLIMSIQHVQLHKFHWICVQ